jgi:hypothetical protein
MEALRVAKLIPDEWLPGVFNGRNVTVKYIIPILFDEYIPLTNIVPEIEKHSDK